MGPEINTLWQAITSELTKTEYEELPKLRKETNLK
jgi:hypothetical protein